MSSFMSSESDLPRIMSIIDGSRFLLSTGGRSDGALSRGVEFSIDHRRRDCIVSVRIDVVMIYVFGCVINEGFEHFFSIFLLRSTRR